MTDRASNIHASLETALGTDMAVQVSAVEYVLPLQAMGTVYTLFSLVTLNTDVNIVINGTSGIRSAS